MLETGIRGKQSVAVTPENTAKTMGSGTLNVFATPALVALAEKTCWMSVADALDEGCGLLPYNQTDGLLLFGALSGHIISVANLSFFHDLPL